MSEIETFNYLRSLLKGEAASLVAGFELSNENYKVAKDLLVDRYGSEKRRQRAHIRKLLDLDCANARDSTSLRSFVDSVHKHLRGLESLGMKSDDFKALLCELLVDKVPDRVKSDWVELNDNQMNLDELLKLVETDSKKIELLKNTIGPCTNIKGSPPTNETHTSSYGTIQTLYFLAIYVKLKII